MRCGVYGLECLRFRAGSFTYPIFPGVEDGGLGLETLDAQGLHRGVHFYDRDMAAYHGTLSIWLMESQGSFG